MLLSSDCRNASDLGGFGNGNGSWNGSGSGSWSGMGNGSGSGSGSDPFGRNEEVAKLEVGVLSVAFVAAVAGNVSVLVAVSRSTREKPSRVRLFMTHLSVADLVVAFFQVLPQLCWDVTFRFHGPDVLCRLVKHLQVLGMFASTCMVLLMSLDRYLAVCHPLRALRRPTRRAQVAVGCGWALSLFLSTPQYFIFSLSEVRPGSEVFDCWGHFVQPWGPRAYVTWITAGVFVLPVAVLLFCYGFICRTIWTNVRSKTRQLGCNSVSGVGTISRAKLRTVKMTLVIVVAYTLCWAPFFTVQMWSVWDDNFSWDDSENATVTLTALLASLNSCCNPWIYLVFSGRLRTGSRSRDSESSVRRTTLRSRLQGPRTSEPFADPRTCPPVPSAS
ncbi:unnamed protein product [Ophioblennius macclurei]